ncbi:hypothetical protein [Yersinia frederiksenii]|uniref:hypothetical protein n=1 Tax=Yersinia frederiksenii TaxID=29484 RepID=UPI0005E1E2E5|nr:PTS system N-acetylgalactosamine-specific EIIC component 1 [Yersinia frederiksenii]
MTKTGNILPYNTFGDGLFMHEITMMQGIGLAIMALSVGIDFWLETLHIFRPLTVYTLTRRFSATVFYPIKFNVSSSHICD